MKIGNETVPEKDGYETIINICSHCEANDCCCNNEKGWCHTYKTKINQINTKNENNNYPENPFESLHNNIVFDVRDWAEDRRSAWIYGIIVGWGDEDGLIDKEEIFAEFNEMFGWSRETWDRLQNLRTEFVRAKFIYNKQFEEVK